MDERKTTTVAVSKDVSKKLFDVRYLLIEMNKKDVSYSYTIDFLIDFYYNKNNCKGV